jgi:hypothetical protein
MSRTGRCRISQGTPGEAAIGWMSGAPGFLTDGEGCGAERWVCSVSRGLPDIRNADFVSARAPVVSVEGDGDTLTADAIAAVFAKPVGGETA